MPPPQRPQQGGNRPQQPQRPAQAPTTVSGPQQALLAVTTELDRRMSLVATSAAFGITPERLKGVALSAFTRTPSLWSCDPVSVARSIVEAGQLGLEPTGLMGGAYLVPRKGQCTLLIGYRGLVMLARRSGEIARVVAQVVYDRDQFDYGYGSDQHLSHVPSREQNRGNVTDVWAMAYYRDGGNQFDVMSYDEVELIRKRSASPTDGPWVTDWGEMAKKTVLRRLAKLLPLTVDVARALDEFDPEVPLAGPTTTAPATRQQQLRSQAQQRLLGAGGETLSTAGGDTVTATDQGQQGQPPQTAANRGGSQQQGGPAGEEPPPPAGAAPAAQPPTHDGPAPGVGNVDDLTSHPRPAAAKAPARPVSTPAAAGAMVACDAPSPYDNGATRCGLQQGHQGRTHRGTDGSTWQ